MRILAVDYGKKRVGLAVSDPSGTLASPFRTLANPGWRELFEALLAVVQEVEAERVLVGLPVSRAGTLSPEALNILRFAHRLAERMPVPVTCLNEAFTTAEAWSRLRGLEGRRRDPVRDREKIDQVAAALLLEEYLTCLPEQPEPLPPLPEAALE